MIGLGNEHPTQVDTNEHDYRHLLSLFDYKAQEYNCSHRRFHQLKTTTNIV